MGDIFFCHPRFLFDTFTLGGRQVNGAVASLSALVDIMQSPVIRAAQAEGKFTILLDSGIRTGSDVIKALALGAQGVLCLFLSMHNASSLLNYDDSGQTICIRISACR